MPKVSKNAVYVFDFTLPQSVGTPNEIVTKLCKIAKKFTFQLEKGSETGYMHYQGRMSLRTKTRSGALQKQMSQTDLKGMHVSVTSNQNKDNCFYVLKDDTKVDGPWSDKDLPRYIPRQYRIDKLRPWQDKVLQSANVFNSREINAIIDYKGGIGKSTIAGYASCKYDYLYINVTSDAERIVSTVADILISREEREPKLMFVDIPRSYNSKRLPSLFTAVEIIKGGIVSDTRYRYRSWCYDSPALWVFINEDLPTHLQSRDRWKFWKIVDNDLVPSVPVL